MRVLFYNWADYLDPEKRGGGVSVYQHNLIERLAECTDIETAFVSSGLMHDLKPGAPRIVPLSQGTSPRFALVNSGLVAPSHADFGGAAQLDHAATEAAFADFVQRTGPWDIIHFNTLEGLPANVLALRAHWPRTRFVLSLHNYYPFCPQVNLWHHERETCPGFDGGARCADCLTVRADPRSIRFVYAVGTTLARIGAAPGTGIYDKGFRPLLGFGWRSLRKLVQFRRRLRGRTAPVDTSHAAPIDRTALGRPYAERRARMTDLVAQNCDAVLCVSDRVRQIAMQYGLPEDRLHTLYIGSREAEAWDRTTPRAAFLNADGMLRLAYLGYMRRDKGYFFLLEALAALPDHLARRIHLTVAAKKGDTEAMALLTRTRARLGGLVHRDGYRHDQLDALLADIDLGVVPPIWEDNLPQVAIEMHARHIPVLTSDRGGARELGQCDALVFKAGDAQDFARALARVLDGAVTPGHYWAKARAPKRMSEHVDELLALYRTLE